MQAHSTGGARHLGHQQKQTQRYREHADGCRGEVGWRAGRRRGRDEEGQIGSHKRVMVVKDSIENTVNNVATARYGDRWVLD